MFVSIDSSHISALLDSIDNLVENHNVALEPHDQRAIEACRCVAGTVTKTTAAVSIKRIVDLLTTYASQEVIAAILLDSFVDSAREISALANRLERRLRSTACYNDLMSNIVVDDVNSEPEDDDDDWDDDDDVDGDEDEDEDEDWDDNDDVDDDDDKNEDWGGGEDSADTNVVATDSCSATHIVDPETGTYVPLAQ